MQDASSKEQTGQKYKPNHQQIGLPPHSALPIKGGEKKKKLTSSHLNASTSHILHEAYTNHLTKLMRAETKREKEFNLESWGKETSNTISLKKLMKRQRNASHMKEQTRNAQIQISEEETGKLPKKDFRIMIVKMIQTLKIKWRKWKNQLTKT